MKQVAAPDFQTRTIPIEKALLFRTESNRGNPEGYSLLRNAYRPWRMKTRIENIEGIGVERDLAGLPVAWVPPDYMDDNAPEAKKAVFEAMKTLATGIKRDEEEGVVMPTLYDEHGNKLFDLTLLSTGGQRQFDTNAIIGRYDQRILMSVMADFLMLGAEKVGSFALSVGQDQPLRRRAGRLARRDRRRRQQPRHPAPAPAERHARPTTRRSSATPTSRRRT
jgi:hypothetical protein